MPASAWIDRTAADLLDLEAELRPLLRRLAYNAADRRSGEHAVETAAAPRAHRSVTISATQARTLLRAAMPVPVAATHLRQPHARMLAAMQLFSAHLLSLNDPATAPAAAAAAGAALLAELRTWLEEARWHQACRAAGVRWPRQQACGTSISAVLRQQTGRKPEHGANTLPAMAEQHRVGTDPMGAQTARTGRRKATEAAVQDALELARRADADAPASVPLRPAPAPPRKTNAAGAAGAA